MAADAFLAVFFTTVRARVVSFVVRLVLIQSTGQRTVLRYDTAHGMPHRDVLSTSGRLVCKDWLADASFEDALTLAINHLKVHHEEYLRRFREAESR